MKVLVLCDGQIQTDGGGHTLSQDILQALISKSYGHAHEFCLLDVPDNVRDSLPKHFFGLQVKVPREPLLQRVAVRLKYLVKRRLSKINLGIKLRVEPPHITSRREALRVELRMNRVDCALSLVPWLSFQYTQFLPNIVTVWDLEHRRKPYFPEVAANGEWEARERIYSSILPKAISVIVGTDAGKKQIEHFYGVDSEAVSVIPFPTPSFALKQGGAAQDSRSELPPGISGEFLFYPAQYWSHKNHIRVLQALKILIEEHGWQGSLVCCGSDKGNLAHIERSAVQLGVKHRVNFLGFVNQSELVGLYQHALAMTFVSYFGPDNLPPLEAFALGCPLIASDIEGAKEALGDSALYVNPDSATEIASCVMRLKREPGLRNTLISLGRTRATKFTVDDYVDHLLRLLDSLECRFECFRGLSRTSSQ